MFRHLSWEERKNWKLRALWLISGAIGSIIAVLLPSVLSWFGLNFTSAAALTEFGKKLGLLDGIVKFPRVVAFVERFPDLTLAAFGFVFIGGAIGATRPKEG